MKTLLTFILIVFLNVNLQAQTESLTSCAAPDSAHNVEEDIVTDAWALHGRMITLDSHASFTSDPLSSCEETDRQVDFAKMRAGGLDAVFFSVYAPQRERTPDRYADAEREAREAFRRIHELVEQCTDAVELARSPEDVERIVGVGKLVVAIGIENGFTIGRDRSLLKTYRELGAAYVGLTHDGNNDIADSAIPKGELGDSASEHGGVSDFGEQVIRELNRLGIMEDVSHMSRTATLDAIRISRAPIIDMHQHALATDQSGSPEVQVIPKDQAKQEIREAQQHWMEAAIRKDETVLRQILGDEYHLIAGRLGLIDKDGWLAMGPDYTIEEFEYMESDIHVYGDTAISNSRFWQKATYQGADLSGEFYLTDVWVKRDGRWQVVTRHSSIAESP